MHIVRSDQDKDVCSDSIVYLENPAACVCMRERKRCATVHARVCVCTRYKEWVVVMDLQTKEP